MTNKHISKRFWLYPLSGLILLLVIAAVSWFTIALSESQISGDRAPYLQMTGPDRVTLRWGTAHPGVGEVHYGEQPDQLAAIKAEDTSGTDHRVVLSGLQADSRYYYRVKQNGKWLVPQAEWFHTAPAAGVATPTRIWVLGDPGIPKSTQQHVRDVARRWLEQNPRAARPLLDFILTTGDNAYPNGTNAQYHRGFFMPFGEFLKNISVWPVYGNHDARRWAFYRIFDRPEQGELGGAPSQDKAYFSLDYANTHVIVLDSHHGDLSIGSPMMQWLEKDLLQTRQNWTVVLFHHPPYTKGTHDSDSPHDSAARMVRVREFIVPMLEQAGVDLVISGHSHNYERSALIHCHYANSTTFAPWMIRDKGVVANGATQYSKPHTSLSPYDGTMYMVLGSSGEGNKIAQRHPAMAVSSDNAGSLILDIDGQQLTGRYLNATGVIEDSFVITKGTNEAAPRIHSCGN